MASPQCCANPPALNPASGQGSVVEDLGGLPAYAAGSPDSGHAVLLVSDIFGFEAPNLRCSASSHITHASLVLTQKFSHVLQLASLPKSNCLHEKMCESFTGPASRKIADKVAASGYFVVVPDFLYGDPYAPENAERPLQLWIKSHSPDKGFEDAKQVIVAIKNKGISVIGAGGFCWGAKVVTELAKSGEIQAGVLLHPYLVTLDDINEVKCPIAILGAEVDHLSPPALVKQFEEVLSSKSELDSFVKIFDGVAHGWTVRFKDDDEFEVKKAEEAHHDMLAWFNKIIKKTSTQ